MSVDGRLGGPSRDVRDGLGELGGAAAAGGRDECGR